MSESNAEQDRIEANHPTTRSRMDARLSELQDKLAPGQVVEDFLDYLRGNGGGEFVRNLMASVQANPVPAVVAGVGLAWLMAANYLPRSAVPSSTPQSRLGSSGYPPYATPYQRDDLEARMRDAEASVHRLPDDDDQSFSDRLADARGKVLGVARHAQDTAATFAHRVQEAWSGAMESATRGTHDARDQVAGMAGKIVSSAQNLGGQMKDSATQMGGQFRNTAQQVGGQLMERAKSAQQGGGDLFASISGNPLALGAIGLATGALLGLLLPHSEQEDAALGGVATQARGAVRDMAQAAVDQGSSVVQAAMDTAKQSAASHGFSADKSVQDVVGDVQSGDLIQNAKQVAQDVLNAGSEAIKKGQNGADNPA